jgi:hypothetical protein
MAESLTMAALSPTTTRGEKRLKRLEPLAGPMCVGAHGHAHRVRATKAKAATPSSRW